MDLRKNNREKRSKTKKGIALVLGIVLIWFFMFYLGPWAENIPMVRPVLDSIEENNIDAGAYFYTDIEEFAEAESAINHSMAFSPNKN